MPEILWFETLDSTRTKLEELMLHQVRPIMVLAHEQSKGRGQVGRAWDSPKGNLYCSFSLMIGSSCNVSRLSLLPLLIAYVLREVVKKHYLIPLTIKWPNDLLIDGKKVGGILCEAQSSQDKVDWVSVGFGLNTLIPGVSAKYASTSLSDYRSADYGQESLKKILQAVYARVEELFIEVGKDSGRPEWLDELEKQQKGTFLVDGDTGKLHHLTGLGDDGHLDLLELDVAGNKKSLYSANHSFKFLTQDHTLPRLFADIGNTSAKVFFTHQDRYETLVLDHALSTAERVIRLTDFFSKFRPLPTHFPIHGSSVNPQAFARLAQELRNAGPIQLDLVPKKRVFSRGDYHLHTLGLDRLCLIEGLVRKMMPLQSKGSKVAVVVSLGTATTVDGVDHSGLHLGGMILPGLATSLEALERKGAMLPKLNLNKYISDFDAGKRFQTTESAMIEGCLHATVGSVLMFIQNLNFTEPEVYLTGGYAELLQAYLKKSEWKQVSSWEMDGELLFEGLQSIAFNS